ncbi:MAG: patatin-like phospholipase family protein, partial [Alphaproteobacteria bacterium]
ANAKPINLALQGGGAHGAFSWGVLDKLLEDGRLAIEGLSGTSAGSMNAVVYAYGKMTGGPAGARELLEAFWRAVSRAGHLWSPVRMLPWHHWWTGSWNIDETPSYLAFSALTGALSPYDLNPWDFNPLRDALAGIVRFEDLPRCRSTKLFLSATDVRTGRVRVFRTAEVTLDAVMASAALPMLYKAVEIGEHAYWDGGYVGNPSLWPFFYETGTDDLLIMHVNPIERPDLPRRAPEIANRINEVTFNSSLIAELRAIHFVQKLIREGWLKDEFRGRLRDIRVHAIRTDEALADLSVASKFNPDWGFLCELRDRGRKAASEWLEATHEAIGTRETVDIGRTYLGGQ